MSISFVTHESIIGSLLPTKGSNIIAEIKCYGLPYGGVGFTSHILTYYTMTLLAFGLSPWTWKRNKHWKFDCTLAILALTGTTVTSIIAMIRCRNRWQFVCIAVWKICMSFALSLLSLHSSLIVRDNKSSSTNKSFGRTLIWILLYLPGLVTGLVGLGSVIRKSWENEQVRKVTVHFSSMSLAMVSIVLLLDFGAVLERIQRRRMGYNTSSQSMRGKLRPKDTYLPILNESDATSNTLDGTSPAASCYAPRPQSHRFPALESIHESDVEMQPMLRTVTNSGSENNMRESIPRPASSAFESLTTQAEKDSRTNKALSQIGLTGERVQAVQTTFQKGERFILKNTVRKQYEDAIHADMGVLSALGAILLFLIGGALTIAGVLAALYSDFILGAVASNMKGWPSSDNAVFYWIYFAAKRLPIFFA